MAQEPPEWVWQLPTQQPPYRFLERTANFVLAVEESTVTVFDARTGAFIRKIGGHSSYITGLCALDEATLATAAGDGTIRLTSIETGRTFRTIRIRERNASIDSAVFDAVGRRAIVKTSNGVLYAISLDTGAIIAPPFQSRLMGRFTQSSLSPARDRFLSAVAGGRLIEWQLGQAAYRILPIVGRQERDHVYTPDGRYILTATDDLLNWRSPSTGEIVRSVASGFGEAVRVRVSPDSRVVAVGSSDLRPQLFDVETGAYLCILATGLGYVTDMVFTDDSSLIAVATNNGELVACETATGALRWTASPIRETPWRVTVSPTGQRFMFAGYYSSRCTVRDTSTGAVLWSRPHTVSVPTFSPDGSEVFGYDLDRVYFLDSQTGDTVRSWSKPYSSMAVASPNHELVAVAPNNWPEIRLYDKSGTHLRTIPVRPRYEVPFEFSADGRRFAAVVGSGPVYVQVFDASTGEILARIDVGSYPPVGISLSHDGSRIVVPIDGRSASVFSVETGQLVGRISLPGEQPTIWTARYQSQGRQIAVGGFEAGLRIYDAETLNLVASVRDDIGRVYAVAPVPRTKLLLTAGTMPALIRSPLR